MSWINTSFLWRMYRSGWGTEVDQEVVLAVWMKRPAFDAVLEQAVHSRVIPEVHGSRSEWEHAAARSSVQLQWDPDRDLSGTRMDRRAIQLGLCRDALAVYAQEWIVGIEDVSDFVRQQRQHVRADPYSQLITPRERVYLINDPRVAAALGLSAAEMN